MQRKEEDGGAVDVMAVLVDMKHAGVHRVVLLFVDILVVVVAEIPVVLVVHGEPHLV